MREFTVSFFGHRIVENALAVEKSLEQLVTTLLREQEYVVFLVGRDGEFDQIVSSVIRRCKRAVRGDNSAHVWVLPYMNAQLRQNEELFRDYYDEIEICESSAGVHFKSAHQKRNRSMVDRSDLVVFYVLRENGGAWQTMTYAQKQGKPCLNISDAKM